MHVGIRISMKRNIKSTGPWEGPGKIIFQKYLLFTARQLCAQSSSDFFISVLRIVSLCAVSQCQWKQWVFPGLMVMYQVHSRRHSLPSWGIQHFPLPKVWLILTVSPQDHSSFISKIVLPKIVLPKFLSFSISLIPFILISDCILVAIVKVSRI